MNVLWWLRLTLLTRVCHPHAPASRTKSGGCSVVDVTVSVDAQSPDDKKAMAAIKLAFDNGVNFFDVAPFYGAGDAERLLGRGLQQLPRDQIFVGTKVCPAP